jgi:hypothetical protein
MRLMAKLALRSRLGGLLERAALHKFRQIVL